MSDTSGGVTRLGNGQHSSRSFTGGTRTVRLGSTLRLRGVSVILDGTSDSGGSDGAMAMAAVATMARWRWWRWLGRLLAVSVAAVGCDPAGMVSLSLLPGCSFDPRHIGSDAL